MARRASCLITLALVMVGFSLEAQYFGRNKPNYETFEFEVLRSPHFTLYHYLRNEALAGQFLGQAEEWYSLHQHVLRDTIKESNPIVLYGNHADFQQTNTIGGNIGVGTGGVTEAFKNRVVMPIAMSNQQTHHVLGHELVHAFQYNMILNGDSTSMRNLGNLPLWMIEGLAEYLSIGGVDAHTAMWMRDAVLHDDVPSLRQLNNPRYFPYRYGQVFWAFVTGLAGDDIIEPLFTGTAKYGFDIACQLYLKMSSDNLSTLWVSALTNHYKPYLGDQQERFVGKAIAGTDRAGRLNISPEISPDGRYLIFMSERDVFGIDLFLAEARSGEIIRKVASATRSGHIDDFNYIESSGTWHPRGNQFAFVGIAKGENILIIKDTETGKSISETTLPGIPAFSNPSWSPDGHSIVVVGLVDGQTDLYRYELRSQKITQLTDDSYAELHPSWSADGSLLFFSTDRLSLDRGTRTAGRLTHNLASLDPISGQQQQYDIFPGADNLNPREDANGDLLFISDRDGFRNLYRYDLGTNSVFQQTDLLTGISGITHFSPAFSVDRKRNRVVYTYFSQQGYRIYQADAEDMLNKAVDPRAVDMEAARLPRVNPRAPMIVDEQLTQLSAVAPAPLSMTKESYRPKFQLDYVGGGAGVGVGTNNVFGTTNAVVGGIDLLFSDMVGNNQLMSSLSLNGEITDFGGALTYINRKQRVSWGASISHFPFRSLSGLEFEPLDTVTIGNQQGIFDRSSYFLNRLFQDQLGFFAQYPFSTTFRLETSASFALYSNRVDRYDTYYYPGTFLFFAQQREKVEGGGGFTLGRAELAAVGDKSYFGLTSPLSGSRYRLGVEQFFSDYQFTALTADYRKYHFFRPIGLAFRLLHYGRYGKSANELFPLYLGTPWYLRGLNNETAEQILLANGRDFEDLLGSRVLVANAEIRIPLSGPRELALIPAAGFLSDINFFIDGGLAWYLFDQLSGPIYRLGDDGRPLPDPQTGLPIVVYRQAKPLYTTGVSLRINVFGSMVVEPYYAIPLLKPAEGVRRGSFGINLLPGW